MKKRSNRHSLFVSVVCIVLVVLFVLSISVFVIADALAATSSDILVEINSLKSQRSTIQEEMDAIQEEIDGLDDQKTSALEKKAILDEKNELAQEELDVIQEQIDIIDTYLANRQQDLADAQEREETQREAWLARLRTMEESSSLSYIQVLFDATNFSDLISRIDLVNEMMEYDEELWNSYIEARENVETLEAEAEEMFAVNEENKAELEEKKAQLEEDINAACQMIAELESSIDSYNALMEEEEAAEEAINEEISNKQAEYNTALANEQAAAAAAAAQYSNTGGSVTVSGNGEMLWPSYCTTISSYYGNRLHPVYGYYKFHAGVDIAASYGTAIYACADGVVTSAAYGSGYGNYVSISCDNGYTTLCAHMSSVAVSSGERVTQGQVIGYVGSTGVSTGPHIHFEVNGGGTDPLSIAYIYA